MREWGLNLWLRQDPAPRMTEVHLQPALLRSAGTYIVAGPWEICIRARPDAPASLLEKLQDSNQDVKVITSDQSPFCAVRTVSSLDQKKTVFLRASCGETIEFEGKKMVLLEGTIVGLGFAASLLCCDQRQPDTRDCPHQCRFSDINYLIWSKDEKKQQKELLNPFTMSLG